MYLRKWKEIIFGLGQRNVAYHLQSGRKVRPVDPGNGAFMICV